MSSFIDIDIIGFHRNISIIDYSLFLILTKELTSCLTPGLQKTSIRFSERFLTAVHSGKMYIRHLFRYGQLFKTHLRRSCKYILIYTLVHIFRSILLLEFKFNLSPIWGFLTHLIYVHRPAHGNLT